MVDVAVQSAGAPQRIKWALGPALAARRRRGRAHAAAEDRAPTSRPSTPSSWRGRSRRWAYRCSPASATRSTAASPTRSRTPPARPPPRPRSCSSDRSTSSSPGSTTRPSGWRRGRASAWPSPVVSSTTRARRARRSAIGAVAREHSRLDRAHGRLDELARRRTTELGARLDTCAAPGRRARPPQRRATGASRSLAREREWPPTRSTTSSGPAMRLARSEAVVRALDPRRVLERGYSITRDADGRVVRTSRRRWPPARWSRPSSRVAASPAASRASPRRRNQESQ